MMLRGTTFIVCLTLAALAWGDAPEQEVAAREFLRSEAGKDAEGYAVPVDKGLDPAWVRSLCDRGERKIYRGKELYTIGMPCGGIGAGQLYVRGDGTLARWWIFGRFNSTNWWNGAAEKNAQFGYHTYRPASEVEQGFALRMEMAGQAPQVVTLSEKDFDAIEFVGEYPIAEVRYKRRDKPALPVAVTAEVFTPWIPLCPRDSANPATIFKFTLTNTSDKPVDVSLAGWLENAVRQGEREAGIGPLAQRDGARREDGLPELQGRISSGCGGRTAATGI